MAIKQYNVDTTTVTINGRILNDFVAGNTISISFPNDRSSMVAGQDSVVYSQSVIGDIADITLNILQGSNDDTFLLNYANTNTTFSFTITTTRIDGAGTEYKEIVNCLECRIMNVQTSDYDNVSPEHLRSYIIKSRSARHGAA